MPPLMIGPAPIRRTAKYLEMGKLILKESVRIVTFNYNTNHKPSEGTDSFLFWHFAQLQYKNPSVHMCVFKNMTPSPFLQFFCANGSKLVMDVFDQDKDSIHQQIKKVFCKTDEVLKAEALAEVKSQNPSHFGYMCHHECMCEIPGQVPCSRFQIFPKEMRGKYKKMLEDKQS